MTRDEALQEIARALRASFPDRADALLRTVELGWVPGDPWRFELGKRVIHVDQLRVWPTYEGVLAGIPDRQMVYGWAREKATGMGTTAPIHIVEPPQKKGDHPEQLPEHACIALLRSDGIGPPDPQWVSVSKLLVVYFVNQESPLSPVHFAKLAWDELARDEITEDGY